MFVLNADLRNSRRHNIDMHSALETARARSRPAEALPSPEITMSDEIQGAFDDPAQILLFIQALQEVGDWHIGIGIGEVKSIDKESIRKADGPAFWAARKAVEDSKRYGPQVIGGTDPHRSHAQAVLRALTHIVEGRSVSQNRVVKEYRRLQRLDDTKAIQQKVAKVLGVSAPAVSKTLSRAAVDLENELSQALAQLLAQAHPDY